MTAMTFDDFWRAYPRKENKKGSADIWKRKGLDAVAVTIVAHVQRRAKDDQKWSDGYIPMPATFLNQERWNDEYQTKQRRDPALAQPKSTYEPPVDAQRDRYKAGLNMEILLAIYPGGVREEDLQVILATRDRLAKQLREMYGDDPKDRAEYLGVIRGMRAHIRNEVARLRRLADGAEVAASERQEPASHREVAAPDTGRDGSYHEPRGERVRGHSGGVQAAEFPL